MELNGKEYLPVPGHRQYAVSKDGEIVRTEGGRKNLCPLAKTRHTVKGKQDAYLYVTLNTMDATVGDETVDAPKLKHVGLHRLVAMVWIGPQPDDKPWVNHKNGDKSNNHADNLEWTTISENIKHKFDTGLHSMPKGADHWRFGKKHSRKTKKALSEAKKGERHPKFKGWYVKDGKEYASALIAQRQTGERHVTIIRKAKQGTGGWSFKPVKREITLRTWTKQEVENDRSSAYEYAV